MEENIRVCWYCEKWQPGGIQAVQVNLLRHMNLQNIQLDLVVSEDDTALFDETLHALGVKKIVTLQKTYASPGKRVLANIFAFGKLLRAGRYDVVHLNVCHGVELIYSFWAWLYRVPLRIVHCRNNGIGAGGRGRGWKLFCHKVCRALFQNCANVKLANSDLSAAWLFSRASRRSGKVQILKNGIDAARFDFDEAARIRVRAELGLETDFVVGHIGHFSYQKNHAFLLKIFRELTDMLPHGKLLLVGDGGEKEQMVRLAESLGISDRVIFYGVTDAIPPLLMAMDVFVLPSRFEGFGNVLLEAQAAGLPCFASRDVIPEAVQVTENLFWLPLDLPAKQWAEAIAGVKEGGPRKGHADEIVRAGYDISRMAEFLETLYRGGARQ